jgi:homoserine O-acetyltransferase
LRAALQDFTGSLVAVSVDSDRLYPAAQSQELVDACPGARHVRLSSPHGHDGFLIERELVGELIREELEHVSASSSLTTGADIG